MGVDHLLKQFSAFAPLDANELRFVAEAVSGPRTTHSPGHVFLGKGQILLDGWVASMRAMQGGSRQLVQLCVVGQPLPAIDFQDEEFVALTHSATISGSPLRSMADRAASYPNLAAALKLMEMEGRYFLNEQIARLGQMSALERLANLLLEVWHRWRVEGIVVPMPLTQQHLADLLGLSVVHVNRTVKEMQRRGLVEWKHREVKLVRLDELKQLGTFDPPSFTAYRPEGGQAGMLGVYPLRTLQGKETSNGYT